MPNMSLRVMRAVGRPVNSAQAAVWGNENERDLGVVVYAIGAGAIVVRNTLGNQTSKYLCPPLDETSAASSRTSSPGESPNMRKGKDRVNHASAVTATRELVAIGETGYLPRIVLFNFDGTVLASVVRHQFGIKHLQFSPDGTYIASLGTPQDGYICVWTVGPGTLTLHSSNRCISEVHDLRWINCEQLVTCGVRHARVWTVGDNDGVLTGRSVLLGDYAYSTFDAVCTLSSQPGSLQPFVLATSDGEILEVDGPIRQVATTMHRIRVMRVVRTDGGLQLLVAGRGATWFDTKTFEATRSLSDGTYAEIWDGSPSIFSPGIIRHDKLVPAACMGLEAHGLCQNSDASWTCSDRTLVHFPTGDSVELRLTDTTRVLANPVLAAANAHGLVAFVDEVFAAHSGPVTSLDHENGLVLSSGRDKLVCVYAVSEAEDCVTAAKAEAKTKLQETLQLGSPVISACFSGKTIYAVCANRTLQTWSRNGAKYSLSRCQGLRSTPTALTVTKRNVLISTLDRQVSIFDLHGVLQTQWRPTNASGDAVTVLRMAASPSGSVVAAATGDKMIAIYDIRTGAPLAFGCGHSDPIASVTWVDETTIATAGGGVFWWRLENASPSPRVTLSPGFNSPRRTPLLSSPLRSPKLPSLPLSRSVDQRLSHLTFGSPLPHSVENSPRKPASVGPSRVDGGVARILFENKTAQTTDASSNNYSVTVLANALQRFLSIPDKPSSAACEYLRPLLMDALARVDRTALCTQTADRIVELVHEKLNGIVAAEIENEQLKLERSSSFAKQCLP